MSYFDIVIPAGPNDISMIHHNIKCIKKNVIGYRNIYIVTPAKYITVDGAIIVQDYFSIDDIAKYHKKSERNGWYLQQLLKLYAWKYIPGILDTYLVVDSDTFFVKPTTFIQDSKCLYATGSEYHVPYFQHMERLHPNFRRATSSSGICHHMMFQTKYLKQMIKLVEDHHGNKLEFWEVFLTQVNPTQIPYSGASEYEIYFHFMVSNYPESIEIRQLNWANSPSKIEPFFDFISWHWYSRDSNYKTFLAFLSEYGEGK
jgi:hypothetical protein